MKHQQFSKPQSCKLVRQIIGPGLFQTISPWVTRENVGKVSLRSKIVKKTYKLPSTMVRANFFVNPKVVSWYVNFLEA